MRKTCRICNVRKPVEEFYWRSEQNKYRSMCKACYAIRRAQQRERLKISATCAYCGKDLKRLKRKNNLYFCNCKCKGAYRSEQCTEYTTCLICDKKISYVRWRPRPKFCKHCVPLANAYNHNTRTLKGSSLLKEYVHRLFSYQCAMCAYPYAKRLPTNPVLVLNSNKPHPFQLDVHHIDHNRDNNNPENLILLCRRCHARVSQMDDDDSYRIMFRHMQERRAKKWAKCGDFWLKQLRIMRAMQIVPEPHWVAWHKRVDSRLKQLDPCPAATAIVEDF